MSWPKPNITNIVRPPVQLNRGRWGLFITALAIISSFILAKAWPNDSYASQWTYWVGVAFFPTLIGGSAFSIRLYLYGLAQEKYDIWQDEQKKVEQNWQKWAMKSLLVLDSAYVIPDEITASSILENGSNLHSKINKSLKFKDKSELTSAFDNIFCSMSDAISILPSKANINISLYMPFDSYENIDREIARAYRNSGIKHDYNLNYMIDTVPNIEKIAEWIDSPQPMIELIIINNTQSSASEFLAAFLLVNNAQYQDLEIKKAKAQILRPMIDEELPIAIKQMVEMQPAIKQVSHLWFVNLDNKQETEINKQLVNQSVEPEQLYGLEKFVGKQTELSYWLALAMSSEMINKTKRNNLIATRNQNQWLFSVVTLA